MSKQGVEVEPKQDPPYMTDIMHTSSTILQTLLSLHENDFSGQKNNLSKGKLT